jgi:hypothetical protein
VEAKADAIGARSRVLAPLEAAGAPSPADALELLHPQLSPVPFRGRSRELGELREWLAGRRGAPGFPCTVGGPAGVGKTRLALELGRQVPAGWVAGWLRPGAGPDACAAVGACGEPALILVDDADLRPDLIPLAQQLARHWRGHGTPAPVIRVLLVGRCAAALARLIMAGADWGVDQRRMSPVTLTLAPDCGPDLADDIFRDAVGAFASVLRGPPPRLAPVARAGVPLSAGDRPESFGMMTGRALLVTLDAVHGRPGAPGRDPRTVPPATLAAELVRHEQDRWNAATEWDWGRFDPPSRALRDRVMTALTLLGADAGPAEQVMGLVPMPRGAPAGWRHAIAAWVTSLYPPGAGIGMSPGLAGEWFVTRQLAAHPRLARSLRAELTAAQQARALGFLARAAGWVRGADRLFAEFADGGAGGGTDPRILAVSGAAMAGTISAARLDAMLAGQLPAPDCAGTDQLAQLDAACTSDLPKTRAAIAERRVSRYRDLSAKSAVYWFGLAEALHDLAGRLDSAGRWSEGQAARREASTLDRALYSADKGFPAALRYLLADPQHERAALAVLGAARRIRPERQEYRLMLPSLWPVPGFCDLPEETLHAAREAVMTQRAYLAGTAGAGDVEHLKLAHALARLGAELARNQRYVEATEVTREAVMLWESRSDPVRRPIDAGYPRALLDLSVRLGKAGHAREAREARERALRVARDSFARGGTYLPRLALTDVTGWFSESDWNTPARLLAEVAFEDLPIADDLAGSHPAGNHPASGHPANGRPVIANDGRLDLDALLEAFVSFWKRHGEATGESWRHPKAAPDHVLAALLERVAAVDGTFERRPRSERRKRPWPAEDRWWDWTEMSVTRRYRGASGALAGQRAVIIAHLVRPPWHPRSRKKTVAFGLAQLDGLLAARGEASGALAIFDPRARPPGDPPDPRVSRARTPRGHDVTVLTC